MSLPPSRRQDCRCRYRRRRRRRRRRRCRRRRRHRRRHRIFSAATPFNIGKDGKPKVYKGM